jgi:acetyltransferase-like isoleucine patch superfamily enzyme
MNTILSRFYLSLDSRFVRLLNVWRLTRLRLLGAKIGNNVRVYGRFSFAGDARNITIGKGCTINEGVFLNARDKISIGNYVHLSPYVQLHTGSLVLAKGNKRHTNSPISIADFVWLASGVIVLPGICMGPNSVAAAGAVVSEDVAENTLVGGIPARTLNKLDERNSE